MKPYSQYYNTDIQWIGLIPGNWSVKKIKHTSYIKGRIGWQGLKTEEYLTEGFAYLVTGTDFNNGQITWDSCYYVDEARYALDSNIQLNEGDLLITKDGTIGKTAIVKDMKRPSTLNSGIFILRSLNGYLIEYMYWILNSSVFERFFEFMQTGTTINHLYQNVFEEFKFPLPNIVEQKCIDKFLKTKTCQIDNLIAKKQQLIELLQEERTAIINQAVTKGLDPDVPMKDSGIEWIGGIPCDWEILAGRHLYKILAGFAPEGLNITENGETDYYKVDDLNYISDGYLLNSINRVTAPHPCKYVSPFILFPKRGAAIQLNKVEVVNRDCLFDTNLMGLNITSERLNIYFLRYYLKFRGLWDIADTSTIPQINNKHILPLKIPIPPITEQSKIVNYLDNKISHITQVTNKISYQIKLLTEYKTALINEAVTGKIDVRDHPINHASVHPQ